MFMSSEHEESKNILQMSIFIGKSNIKVYWLVKYMLHFIINIGFANYISNVILIQNLEKA